MALKPLQRPASSTQVLRYRGTVAVGAAASTVYPQVPGVIPSNAVITGTYFDAYVRFPLFSVDVGGTNLPVLADTSRRLPQFVFDDNNPAGTSPHTEVACTLVTGATNVADLSMNLQSWAQNAELSFNELPTTTALVLYGDMGVAQDNIVTNGVQFVLDTATSGMGMSSGLPVAIVHFRVLNNAGALQAFNVDLRIEIRHSAHR